MVRIQKAPALRYNIILDIEIVYNYNLHNDRWRQHSPSHYHRYRGIHSYNCFIKKIDGADSEQTGGKRWFSSIYNYTLYNNSFKSCYTWSKSVCKQPAGGFELCNLTRLLVFRVCFYTRILNSVMQYRVTRAEFDFVAKKTC